MPTWMQPLPSATELLAVALMCAATFSTRVLGWLLLRNRTVSPALKAVLDAAPLCVMVSIAAPAFVEGDKLGCAVLIATIFIARFASLPVTVLAAVGLYGVAHAVLT